MGGDVGVQRGWGAAIAQWRVFPPLRAHIRTRTHTHARKHAHMHTHAHLYATSALTPRSRCSSARPTTASPSRAGGEALHLRHAAAASNKHTEPSA